MDKITMLKLSGNMIYINAQHRRPNMDKWVFLAVGGEGRCFDINRKMIKGITDQSQYPPNLQSFEDVVYWAEFWKERKQLKVCQQL